MVEQVAVKGAERSEGDAAQLRRHRVQVRVGPREEAQQLPPESMRVLRRRGLHYLHVAGAEDCVSRLGCERTETSRQTYSDRPRKSIALHSASKSVVYERCKVY